MANRESGFNWRAWLAWLAIGVGVLISLNAVRAAIKIQYFPSEIEEHVVTLKRVYCASKRTVQIDALAGGQEKSFYSFGLSCSFFDPVRSHVDEEIVVRVYEGMISEITSATGERLFYHPPSKNVPIQWVGSVVVLLITIVFYYTAVWEYGWICPLSQSIGRLLKSLRGK